MRDYGKVHTTFWTSSSVRELSEDGRTLAMYLLTCPHGTIAGVFRLPDGYACEDLQWDAERVREGFKELFGNGFAKRCETTKWVWVMKHLDWNPPENPNQRKAVAKVAMQVPEQCAWKQDFMRVCGPSMGIESGTEENRFETLGEGFLNQEQKQEQYVEEANASSSSAAKLPDCPHVELIDLFTKHLPTLPQPKPELWSGARAKSLASRWKWVLTAKRRSGQRYAVDRASALDFFDRFFAYVAESDFLTGRNGQWGGCDLSWLANETNFAKVMQGNYDNREAA
ncbi:MAG: hypothetical protein J7556_14975 [Acidovorax sp.]|nr:hypothetical protein [Acidovorax sp.]